MDRSEASSDRAQLLGGLSYYEYQQRLGRDVVIPWLDARLDLEGMRVGDFGAHQGGVLDALRDSGRVAGAVGLELSHDVVSTSPFVSDDRFRLEAADVAALAPGAYEFDLILLHDVLEHVPDYRRALAVAAGLLHRDGYLFITFPPYFAAFGGHQQQAAGPGRAVPFLHYLPSRLFFRLTRTRETDYMSSAETLEDITSVRQTKLTLGKLERAGADASLEIVDRELFIVRPEFTIRYGMKVRAAGFTGRTPVLREVAVNGAFYLLRRVRT
jgi:SAM-dependent methyltransferase